MNKIYNFQKKKGNITLNVRIDLSGKTIIRTVVVAAIIVVAIVEVKKWL